MSYVTIKSGRRINVIENATEVLGKMEDGGMLELTTSQPVPGSSRSEAAQMVEDPVWIKATAVVVVEED